MVERVKRRGAIVGAACGGGGVEDVVVAGSVGCVDVVGCWRRGPVSGSR